MASRVLGQTEDQWNVWTAAITIAGRDEVRAGPAEIHDRADDIPGNDPVQRPAATETSRSSHHLGCASTPRGHVNPRDAVHEYVVLPTPSPRAGNATIAPRRHLMQQTDSAERVRDVDDPAPPPPA